MSIYKNQRTPPVQVLVEESIIFAMPKAIFVMMHDYSTAAMMEWG